MGKKKSLKLSSNLLKMKFMKKTAAEEQEELAIEEQKHLIDGEHWYYDTEQKTYAISKIGAVIIEASYTVFENIGFGRFSFNGFNPQIEKINKIDEKEENENDTEINDSDMATYFNQNSLNETLAKRFAKVQKKEPKQKKNKTIGNLIILL